MVIKHDGRCSPHHNAPEIIFLAIDSSADMEDFQAGLVIRDG